MSSIYILDVNSIDSLEPMLVVFNLWKNSMSRMLVWNIRWLWDKLNNNSINFNRNNNSWNNSSRKRMSTTKWGSNQFHDLLPWYSSWSGSCWWKSLYLAMWRGKAKLLNCWPSCHFIVKESSNNIKYDCNYSSFSHLKDTSLHTCAGGLWDVPLPTACLCPPLPEVHMTLCDQHLCNKLSPPIPIRKTSLLLYIFRNKTMIT